MSIPTELRARIGSDYTAVAPMRPPLVRALWVVPFAVLALLAAPRYFNVRSDATELGWVLSWGASRFQAALGFVVIVAALRESIPGRAWGAAALAGWIVMAAAVVIALTMLSSQASLIPIRRGFWFVGAVCLGGSAAMALPVVAIANILAARAYPTRPAIMGALLGVAPA